MKANNISVIQDLPGVGQNLIDQPVVTSSYRVDVLTASKSVNDPAYAAAAAESYLANFTGPLTDAGAFIGWEKLPQHLRQGLSANTESRLAKFGAD